MIEKKKMIEVSSCINDCQTVLPQTVEPYIHDHKYPPRLSSIFMFKLENLNLDFEFAAIREILCVLSVKINEKKNSYLNGL